MKKNYIMPAQRSIEIDAVEMMAQSYGRITKSGNNANISVDTNDDPVTDTSFDGRTSGAWDDEW